MNVVALCGGVGGAKLLQGLDRALGGVGLTAVVNTGDDFVHWGLPISPDLDTCTYWLAGLADEARGWGLAGETFDTLEAVRRLGGPDWFALGDRDLGTHLMRAEWTRGGATPSEIADRLAARLGVRTRVLPMADEPRRTFLETDEGRLDFQTWLVARRGAPRVAAVRFEGTRTPAPAVVPAIEAADLVVVAPSNPYVSVDPILTLEGVREAVLARPTVAVSPIVGGRAVKGPLAEMIPSLAGEPASASAVARHYGGVVDGWVVERGDGAGLDAPVHETATVMRDATDRIRLAREVLDFGAGLA